MSIFASQNKINYLPLVIMLLLIFILPSKTEASIISIKTPESVSVGQRISVDILVDPENQSINSIESTIIFSPSFFDFNGFSVDQSSIPIWVEKPKEKTKGSIHFSGVIPGGIDRLYDPINTNDKAIPIVRLFFISKTSGNTDFKIGSSQVLQNDGKGTATSLTSKGINIAITDNGSKEIPDPILADISIPKPFKISLIERSVFGKTPRLAVFGAEDTEGGIERYEIAVGDLDFQKVESPFPLPYRLFSYQLTARAYDYSGNFREQQVTVPGEKPYGVGIAILILLLVFIGYRLYSRVKKP